MCDSVVNSLIFPSFSSPSQFFFFFFLCACCRVSCRGQIFKVKRVLFWSGAQERCLHNSSRQMNGIFQSAALSIQLLWSVPTSHEFPNTKKGEKKQRGDRGRKRKVDVVFDIRTWCGSPWKLFNAALFMRPNEQNEEPAAGRGALQIFLLIRHCGDTAPTQGRDFNLLV